jgi:hypothetical protein
MRHGARAISVAMAMRIPAIAFAAVGAVCWLWPGAIGGLLFHALPVSVRENVIIGALFFVGAAILLFIRPRQRALRKGIDNVPVSVDWSVSLK